MGVAGTSHDFAITVSALAGVPNASVEAKGVPSDTAPRIPGVGEGEGGDTPWKASHRVMMTRKTQLSSQEVHST